MTLAQKLREMGAYLGNYKELIEQGLDIGPIKSPDIPFLRKMYSLVIKDKATPHELDLERVEANYKEYQKTANTAKGMERALKLFGQTDCEMVISTGQTLRRESSCPFCNGISIYEMHPVQFIEGRSVGVDGWCFSRGCFSTKQ